MILPQVSNYRQFNSRMTDSAKLFIIDINRNNRMSREHLPPHLGLETIVKGKRKRDIIVYIVYLAKS